MGGLFQQKEAASEEVSSDEEAEGPAAAVNAKEEPAAQSAMDTDDNPF